MTPHLLPYQGLAVVNYYEPLITQQMEASDSCKIQEYY
jgi:hypothetical protein